MGKKPFRFMLIVLGMILLVSVLPVIAAANTDDINNMNGLDALGFDTSAMPAGYNPNSTDNPYGRNKVTVNPVAELFVRRDNTVQGGLKEIDSGNPPLSMSTYAHSVNMKLYGDGQSLLKPVDDFFNTGVKTPDAVKADKPLLATASAEGDFSGSGQKGQVVTVGAGGQAVAETIEHNGKTVTIPPECRQYTMSANGGLYLYFTDPVSGAVSERIELLTPEQTIGNGGEDFEQFPYLLQNYLHVTAGDYDGDGVDEIAVYIPEKGGNQGGSRVAVYKLYRQSGDGADAFLNSGKWRLAWTHHLREETYVSNMVSLTSGDFDRDGMDDLATCWGYYFGPSEHQNTASQAWVLFGDKNHMLERGQQIPLTATDDSGNATNIVRAAFAFGDVDGDNADDLILGGQLASDIQNNKTGTRYVAMYAYNGEKFYLASAKNLDVLERKRNPDGTLTNEYLYHTVYRDNFYSSPGCVANITTVRSEGMGTPSYIYLDSILVEYGNDGLAIASVLDETLLAGRADAYISERYYVEYGARAADVTGDGKETLQLMQYALPYTKQMVPDHFSWIYRLFRWPTTEDRPSALYQRALYDAKTRTEAADFSLSFCLPNTDKDTALLEYTGQHYVMYSDPAVLAVLASPPYFSDLNSYGDYMGSSTSYTSSTGSGTGTTESDTISAGAYISFEQEFSFFGVVVAKFETELAYTHGWTWETEQTSTMEQSVTYSTTAGQDTVAFYSIPMEVYVYQSTVPIIDEGTGEITGYDTQKMAVNIPHQASVVTLPLDVYEDIAKDYNELPQISGTVLSHILGKPWTYPASAAGYNKAIEYNGNWSGVNFGNGSSQQEIAMTKETSKSYSQTNAIDFKIGAGAGGFVVGATVGWEGGSGKVTITTSGSSFSGQLHDMPEEAREYGYGYSWKIFSYEHKQGGVSFPVVNYLVRDVSAPPSLPPDLDQNIPLTTDSKIALEWSYSGAASGFQLYRYYTFPDGTGSYEQAFIKASDFYDADPATNTRYYRYIDENLNPYTEYRYQIQTVGATPPPFSIKSPVFVAMTKSNKGYPNIKLNFDPATSPDNPLNVLVYPDSVAKITAVVTNPEDYQDGKNVNYRWQKKVGGKWEDSTRSGSNDPVLLFQNAGLADQGEYRCRVNVMYYDGFQEYYISAYSDVVTVEYAKRQSAITVSAEDITGNSQRPLITARVATAHTAHNVVPTGQVTFTISSVDQTYVTTGQLDTNGIVSVTMEKDLPPGVYEITASYSGSRVFKAAVAQTLYLSGGDGVDGYALNLNSLYTYGDPMTPLLKYVTKNNGKTVESTYIHTSIRYQYVLAGGNDYTNAFVRNGGTYAGRAGDFTVNVYGLPDGGGEELLVSRSFTVDAKPLTLYSIAERKQAGAGITHPTAEAYLADSDQGLVFGDTIGELGLNILATNTAGNQVTIGPATEPGSYTIVGAPGPEPLPEKYYNYRYSFVPAQYVLHGQTFPVKGVAQQLDGLDVGIIELVEPEGNDNVSWSTYHPAGSTLVFVATPRPGYEVKGWLIQRGGNPAVAPAEGEAAGNVLQTVLKAEDTVVTVIFQVKKSTLTFAAQANSGDPLKQGGTVLCVDEGVMLQSGGIVMKNARYTFKATADTGYHFYGWEVHELNKASIYVSAEASEIDPADGLPIYHFTMGDQHTRLYAVFARDDYTLTLNGDLEAAYNFVNEKNEVEEKIVGSGALITGDTEVTVRAKTGFAIGADIVWQRDNAPVDPADSNLSLDNQSYTFMMLADTEFSVTTENQSYSISLTITEPHAGENDVTALVNGVKVDVLNGLAGGSRIELTANQGYGYLFNHWIVTIGGIAQSPNTNPTLVIGALGTDMDIEAVFINNDAYTVEVIMPNPDHAGVSYSLNGASSSYLYGDEGEAIEIPVFAGDSLEVFTSADTNFMVNNWRINGRLQNDPALAFKTSWLLENIVSDHSIEPIVVPKSYYTVFYDVGGGDGSIVNATKDGRYFDSGDDNVGGGSKLVFNAEPDAGNMVERWTVNGDTMLNEYDEPIISDLYTVNCFGNMEVLVYFTELRYREISTGSHENADVDWEVSPHHQELDNRWEVLDGAKVIFTITPDADCRLTSVEINGRELDSESDGITVNDDGSWTYTINSLREDIEITAYALQLHQIKVVAQNGTVQPSVEQAAMGDTVHLTITPQANYRLSALTVSHTDDFEQTVPVTNNSFIMPDADVTVAVTFEFIGVPETQYQISVAPGANGTVRPSVYQAPAGRTVSLTVTPDSGYTLSSLTVTYTNNSSQSVTVTNNSFVMPAADVTIMATFEVGGVPETLYQISVASSANGTVLPSVYQSAAGRTVSLTVTANSGYTLSSLRVAYTNNSSQTVPVTNNSFVMPAADVTVTGAFTTAGGGGGGGGGGGTPVTPVTPIAPIVVPTTTLISFSAFIQGFENNTFRGEALITREQFVAILYRLKAGSPLPQADKNNPSFSDVTADRWSYNAIEWVKNAGIAAADAGGNFRPTESLTRADMAVMLVKAEKLTEMAENTFNDVANHSSRDDILKAVKAGIFTGYPDGSFKPDGNTTRAEAVTALIRYLLGKEPTDGMWQNLSISFTDVPRTSWAYKYIALAVHGYVGLPE